MVIIMISTILWKIRSITTKTKTTVIKLVNITIIITILRESTGDKRKGGREGRREGRKEGEREERRGERNDMLGRGGE